MIMTGDAKKNLASLVMARITKPEAEAPAQDEGASYSEGLMTASEDAMQAVRDSDAHAFMMAMKSFMSLCDQDGE